MVILSSALIIGGVVNLVNLIDYFKKNFAFDIDSKRIWGIGEH